MTTAMDTPRNVRMKRAYRECLLEDIAGEVDARCRRLTAIKGKQYTYFQSVVADWPPEKIVALLRSRVKRLTWPGLPAEKLAYEEAAVAPAFEWPLNRYATPGRPHVKVDYPLRAGVDIDVDKLAIAEMDIRRLRGEFKVDRRALKSRTLSALRPILGKPKNLNGEQLFWTEVAGLTVETDIDFSRPIIGQLLYWHTLYWQPVNESSRVYAEHLPSMSIANMLGGNGGITIWEYLTDADVDGTALLVAQLVEEFLLSVPVIVERARAFAS